MIGLLDHLLRHPWRICGAVGAAGLSLLGLGRWLTAFGDDE